MQKKKLFEEEIIMNVIMFRRRVKKFTTEIDSKERREEK